MKSGSRRTLLGMALAGTLIATWFAPASEDSAVALSERTLQATADSGAQTLASRPAPSGGKPETGRSLEVLRIRDRQHGGDLDEARELFAAVPSAIPKEDVVVADRVALEPPAKKVAPTLPFHVLGRYEESGKVVIFIQNGEQNLIARVGDVLADVYKVETIEESKLSLRYLPLNELQTMEIGSSQ